MTTPTIYNADPKVGFREFEGALVNSSELTKYEPVCIVTAGDSTSANRGRLIAYDGELNRAFVGFSPANTGTRTGNSAGTVRGVAVANGQSLELTISGVTSASIGRDVWCTESGGTYTYSVTPPALDTNAIKVGTLKEVPSTGIGRVQTPMGDLTDQLAATHRVELLTNFVFSGTNTTKTLANWRVPDHMLLIDTYYRPLIAPAGSSATSTITFSRIPGGTGTPAAVTNGGITAAEGDTVNVEVEAGTAPSAANELYRGDHLRVIQAITADGTFSAGQGEVWGVFALLPGE